MSDLDKSFAAAQAAKSQLTDSSESLTSQAARFWELLLESLQTTFKAINGDPAKCKLARGPLKEIDGDKGYCIYTESHPYFSVTIQPHGSGHFTADWKRKDSLVFEDREKTVKSERFVFELDKYGVLQTRTKDGQVFNNESDLALYLLEPFWTTIF